MTDRIPTQIARYLPLGYVGTATMNGYYFKGLLQLEDGEFKYNPAYKKIGAKKKQEKRDSRNNRGVFKNPGAYLNRVKGESIAIMSGGICPVSHDRTEIKEEGKGREGIEKHSGIDILSEEFLRIFKTIRELRREERLT